MRAGSFHQQHAYLIRVWVLLRVFPLLILVGGCTAMSPVPFETGHEVAPPTGCIELRERQPEAWCKRDLEQALRAVHARFNYRSDLALFGVVERWQPPPAEGDFEGDCDEFALAVRQELRTRGIPSWLVYCRASRGTAHLLTEVDGWLLDSRYPRPYRRESTLDDCPYISGYLPGEPWRVVTNVQARKPALRSASTGVSEHGQ